MKANLQTGKVGAASKNAAIIWLLTLPFSGAALSENTLMPPPAIYLSNGISGEDIQNALNSLPAGGGEVVLPPGEFQIRQPVVLRRHHQTLRGAGVATVLRLADNANCPVIIMGEPVNQPAGSVTNLRVTDLMVDGNRSHQQRELWHEQGEGSEIRNNGITVQGVTDSVVERVVAARCRSGGLVTTLGVRRLKVSELEAYDNEFDGLACYLTTDSLFTGLYLHDNPGAGISLDLDFNRNVVSNALLEGNDLGIFMRSSRTNDFHNVSIRDSRHFGVFMAHREEYASGVPQAAPGSECVHNAFTNLVAANCGGAAFRVNNATCTDNVVIRPQFGENRSGGLSQAMPNLVAVR